MRDTQSVIPLLHAHVFLLLLVDLVEALAAARVVGVALDRHFAIVKVEHVRVV